MEETWYTLVRFYIILQNKWAMILPTAALKFAVTVVRFMLLLTQKRSCSEWYILYFPICTAFWEMDNVVFFLFSTFDRWQTRKRLTCKTFTSLGNSRPLMMICSVGLVRFKNTQRWWCSGVFIKCEFNDADKKRSVVVYSHTYILIHIGTIRKLGVSLLLIDLECWHITIWWW